MSVEIQLNGEPKKTEALTVADLVVELGIEKRMIAVERNLEIVPKGEFETTKLENDDRIEVVHMIGGG
ncbi:MAG: sulfur carrier protein ThiS [Mariprofundaceae bacterium]